MLLFPNSPTLTNFTIIPPGLAVLKDFTNPTLFQGREGMTGCLCQVFVTHYTMPLLFFLQQYALLSSLMGIHTSSSTPSAPQEPAAPEHPVSDRVRARRVQIQRAAERAAQLEQEREEAVSDTNVVDMEVDSPTDSPDPDLVEAEHINEDLERDVHVPLNIHAGNQHGEVIPTNLSLPFLRYCELTYDMCTRRKLTTACPRRTEKPLIATVDQGGSRKTA